MCVYVRKCVCVCVSLNDLWCVDSSVIQLRELCGFECVCVWLWESGRSGASVRQAYPGGYSRLRGPERPQGQAVSPEPQQRTDTGAGGTCLPGAQVWLTCRSGITSTFPHHQSCVLMRIHLHIHQILLSSCCPCLPFNI